MKPNRNPQSRRNTLAEKDLCATVAQLQRPEDIQAFLHDLCTPAELQALVDRWQVVRMLEDGHPYRKINELTGVSVTTIGRVARYLTDGHGGYSVALRLSMNNE